DRLAIGCGVPPCPQAHALRYPRSVRTAKTASGSRCGPEGAADPVSKTRKAMKTSEYSNPVTLTVYGESCEGKPLSRWRIGGFLAWIVVLCTAFSPVLVEWAKYATTHEFNSHVLLIPLVSAYVIYCERQRLRAGAWNSFGWGLVLLSIGAAAMTVAGSLHST